MTCAVFVLNPLLLLFFSFTADLNSFHINLRLTYVIITNVAVCHFKTNVLKYKE